MCPDDIEETSGETYQTPVTRMPFPEAIEAASVADSQVKTVQERAYGVYTYNLHGEVCLQANWSTRWREDIRNEHL